MPRDNNGNYAPPVNSWNPAGPNGALAAPADFDSLRNDIANEIGNSLDRSGRGGMLADLPMNNNRVLLLAQPQGNGNALRWEQLTKGSDIASSATLSIPIEGAYFNITGTTNISAISDVYDGRLVYLRFASVLTLVHSSGLVLPRGGNIKTSAGDIYAFVQHSPGVWICVSPLPNIQLGTQVNVSGNLAVDFTGIPASARRVTVNLSEVSTNGSSAIVLRVGTSSGIVSSGYDDAAVQVTNTGTSTVTTGGVGFAISRVASDTNETTGSISLNLIGSNVWVESGVTTITSGNGITSSAGRVQLAGPLERLRLSMFNGTDSFDSGLVNISWE